MVFKKKYTTYMCSCIFFTDVLKFYIEVNSLNAIEIRDR